MRKRTVIGYLACLAILCAATLQSGCTGTSPRRGFAATNDTFITTLQVLTTARETGLISDEDWKSDIAPVIRELYATIKAIDAATKAGIGTGSLLETFRELLLVLRPFLIQAGVE